MNDLEDHLQQNHCTGISLESSDLDVTIYLKLLVLLYADDTVIFGTNAKDFQKNLDTFYDYTNLWKLKINYEKTKIMIFGIRNLDVFQFKLGDSIISICDEFKYQGVIFNKNRSFYNKTQHRTGKESSAYSLQKNSKPTPAYRHPTLPI